MGGETPSTEGQGWQEQWESTAARPPGAGAQGRMPLDAADGGIQLTPTLHRRPPPTP